MVRAMVVIGILAGLVMPATASSHNAFGTACPHTGPTFYGGGDSNVTDNEAINVSVRTMNWCASKGIERPVRNWAVWPAGSNRSERAVIVWTTDGKIHVCNVDHETRFVSGRWYAGYGVRCWPQ